MPRLLALVMTLACAASAQTDIVDNLVSLFTQGNTERASELLDALQGCAAPVSDNLYQDTLSKSLNATRACFSAEINRDKVKECITKSTDAIRVPTSPYSLFSVRALSSTDIATLRTCSDGVADSDAAIVAPFEVLVRRFLQCDVDFDESPSQKEALLDVFKGDAQAQEIARAQLTATCSMLHFGGELHVDVVDFLSQTLHNFAVLFPNRR